MEPDREHHLRQAFRGITLMTLLAASTLAAAAALAAAVLFVVG